MTKLTKPITREVTLNGKEYYVTLDPGKDEPVVSFREKGKRGCNAPFFLLPLEDLLGQLSGAQVAETPKQEGLNHSQMAEKVSLEDEFYITTEEIDGVPDKLRLSVKGQSSEWVTNINGWCDLNSTH
jgi:hypothetical protein|tara:strand:+ start:261 stop:641 length:381 start_codon:yes stop_codon:yes gene_type:complete